MDKLFKNNIFLITVNLLTLFAIFIFLLSRLQYAIVVNDDMTDIISEIFYFDHGRFVTGLISQIFIKLLPQLLNIHLQDFAFVSEGIIKAVIFTLLIYLIGKLFFKFAPVEKKYKFEAPIYLLAFFTIFSVLFRTDFVWAFDTSQFFNGYITSVLFYLLLWNKVLDFYIGSPNLDLKNCILLIFLILCNATGNEEVNTAFFVLLLFLLAESIHRKIKIKQQLFSIDKYIFVSLITAAISGIIVFSSYGVQHLWDAFGLSINFSFSKDYIINFLTLYLNKIFLNCRLLWITFLYYTSIIFFKGRNKEIDLKVIKFVIFSIIGFLIFLFATIVLPENCYFIENAHKFWFLHKGLLSCFELVLLSEIIFLSGYAINTINNKKVYIVNLIILLIFCFSNIFLYFKKIIFMPAIKQVKIMLYMNDKISLHYLKNGQTAIIPKEQPFYILPDVAPDILAVSSPEFYKDTYYKERARYLLYLEHAYGIDASYGITFAPYDEAMELYKASGGGIFTDEELEKLDFSRIKDSLNENILNKT